ncbi:unnamed protein product [Prorocentrum cordatum]|uniref:Transmembrane protein 138 n=1 Tax=Prorocentrum cordatum TaxID=2364126 RepID=A0ABN9XQG5_9DINO|nr:unnamed protein product [Polarella glacialis]
MTMIVKALVLCFLLLLMMCSALLLRTAMAVQTSSKTAHAIVLLVALLTSRVVVVDLSAKMLPLKVIAYMLLAMFSILFRLWIGATLWIVRLLGVAAVTPVLLKALRVAVQLSWMHVPCFLKLVPALVLTTDALLIVFLGIWWATARFGHPDVAPDL